MFTRKKKIGSNLDVTKPENRLTRMLRLNTGFQAFVISLERKDQEDVYNESWKEIENARLEVEYEKAKAITMMQQHRNFC